MYIKQISEDLLYSIGNTGHYSVMTYTGKESKREWMYVLVGWHHVSMDMSLSKFWEMVKDREAWREALRGVVKC